MERNRFSKRFKRISTEEDLDIEGEFKMLERGIQANLQEGYMAIKLIDYIKKHHQDITITVFSMKTRNVIYNHYNI
jgi:hypothetical protein